MQETHIVERKNIDLNKWNALINQYSQGLPYAFSWYLDAVCNNWKIVIYKDYEAGFAFQINKKYGLNYSLHPFLIQQLGFFGKDISLFDNLLKEVEKNVFYYQYQLNNFNTYDKNILELRKNYELQLNKNYEELQKSYKTNTKRNLKKAKNNSIHITKEHSFRPDDMDFILKNSKISFNSIRIKQLKQLLENANKNNSLEIYRAQKTSELIALVIFIKNKIRSVYLMAISTPKGQELKANFLIVDSFIQDNENTNLILDFEGSNIEGIARFYAGFGARESNYQAIKKITFKNLINKIISNNYFI